MQEENEEEQEYDYFDDHLSCGCCSCCGCTCPIECSFCDATFPYYKYFVHEKECEKNPDRQQEDR